MKSKRILSLILSLALMLALFPGMVRSAEARTVVYTEFSYGNHAHTGQGTKESPYNLFEDALENVAPGGTIYIGAKGAFVNIPVEGNPPLEITKNIKIERAPGVSFRPTIEIRKAGLVLGADVTFSNVILSLSNAYHAAIFANGYTLRLENVSQAPNTRVIHLCGGALYDYSTHTSLSPTTATGERSQIIIKGENTKFGNIYAGSINGSFDKDVDINISGVSGSNIGNIYSCGAREGLYNSQNFLDPDNEPLAPDIIDYHYPVSGKVSIELTDSTIRSIDGKTVGSGNASLTVSSENRYSSYLDNLGSVTVKSGTFAPNTLNNDVNVTIEAGGTLDLSSIRDCTVNNFEGKGGILVLNETGCLTIDGSFDGTAELRTPGVSLYTSGIAAYDHQYIKTAGTTVEGANFTFNAYPTQSMTLEKISDGWKTSVQPQDTEKVALESFDIASPVIVTSASVINGGGGLGINTTVGLNVKFTDDTTYEDISMIPFEYDVTYDGTPYGHIKSTNCDGFYIGVLDELHLNFTPGSDDSEEEPLHTIMIANFSEASANSGHIAEGIYDIEITAPTESGYVTRSMRLTVTADGTQGSTDTQTNISVPAENITYNSPINVTANITAGSQDVTDGNAALYINGEPYSASAAVSSGSAVWENIPVTLKNGFKIGANLLEVIYGGNETYSASSSAAGTLTVDKASVKTINHTGEDITADYTGSSMNINFGEFTFKDGNNNDIAIDDVPEIIYTDNADNAVNPIMPGTYTAKLTLPDGEYYTSVSQTGPTLTINPAAPRVILSVAKTNGSSAKLYAEVDIPLGGRIPTGSIDIFDKADNTVVKGNVNLIGGGAEVELTNLEAGENNFYAVYNPDEHSPYTTAQSEDIRLNIEAPTAAPTAEPTSAPTAAPTTEPTSEPATVPTTAPTAAPTAEPTSAPTTVPTSAPTAVPTAEPTTVPTTAPTSQPTSVPTAAPTSQPTSVPTTAPTAAPTAMPTAAPTAEPTSEPSTQKIWDVSGVTTGSIEATFTNLTQKNIENAVMLIAAYDADGTLLKLERAKQSVNAEIGNKQQFGFDLKDVKYSQIKIFVWNSLDKMEPVCENYDQTLKKQKTVE